MVDSIESIKKAREREDEEKKANIASYHAQATQKIEQENQTPTGVESSTDEIQKAGAVQNAAAVAQNAQQVADKISQFENTNQERSSKIETVQPSTAIVASSSEGADANPDKKNDTQVELKRDTNDAVSQNQLTNKGMTTESARVVTFSPETQMQRNAAAGESPTSNIAGSPGETDSTGETNAEKQALAQELKNQQELMALQSKALLGF